MSAAEKSANKQIRHGNRRLVLGMLRRVDVADVASLSESSKLSKMTVHKIIDHYRELGLVSVAGKGESKGDAGKKPLLFRLNPEFRYIFSIQIFETSLLSAVTDLAADVKDQIRLPFAKNTHIEEILDMARDSFDTLAARLGIGHDVFAAVALGTDGVTDSTGGVVIIAPHFDSWGSDVPVRDMLQRRFALDIPMYVDSRIRHQAYAEMKIGAAQGVDRFFMIGTESEGVSAGLVWNGVLARGDHGLAGEIGHMTVDFGDDILCRCGGRGCLEPAVSLVRMREKARLAFETHPDSALFSGRAAEDVMHRDIFSAAEKGDALARGLLDEAAGHFAVAINNVVLTCEPELLVLQGEYAGAGEFFLSRLRERVGAQSLSKMEKRVRIVYSSLGDWQGALGAAHYAADKFFVEVD